MSEKEHWIYDSLFYGTFSIVARKTPSSRVRSHIKVFPAAIWTETFFDKHHVPLKCSLLLSVKEGSLSLIAVAMSKDIASGY